MTRIGKLYQETLRRRSLSFAEFERLLRAFGFQLDRITGSHHIYQHQSVPQRLPIQPDGKAAKLYRSGNFLRSSTVMVSRSRRRIEMAPNYHINVFWSADDACWIADVPDLEYCSAHGATPTDAVSEATSAIQGVVESLAAHGDPIPEPRYRPAIYAARAA